jgi:hypothetical protein
MALSIFELYSVGWWDITNEREAVVRMRIGRGNRENSPPVSLCPSKIPHHLIWDLTRLASVGSRAILKFLLVVLGFSRRTPWKYGDIRNDHLFNQILNYSQLIIIFSSTSNLSEAATLETWILRVLGSYLYQVRTILRSFNQNGDIVP